MNANTSRTAGFPLGRHDRMSGIATRLVEVGLTVAAQKPAACCAGANRPAPLRCFARVANGVVHRVGVGN